MMRRKILWALMAALLCMAVGLSAQTTDTEGDTADPEWQGIVRFKPAMLVVGLLNGVPEIAVDWVPYLTEGLGIPIEINVAAGEGLFAIGALGGVELTPIRKLTPGGLFITAMAGVFAVPELSVYVFAAKADIGFQFLSSKGFVFTPAVGVKYNEINQFNLDLMLDIGFAY